MCSLITIQLDGQVESARYGRLVHLVWAMVQAAGFAAVAKIHVDGTATREGLQADLEALTEALIEQSPFGW